MTSKTKVAKVGFIGLGNIGLPMARNLLGGSLRVSVFDVRPEPVAELEEEGATGPASVAEVAAGADLVQICVRDDAETEAVVIGNDGVLAGARAGTAVAIHGTVHPRTVRRLAEACAPYDVDVVDAPITGGSAGAAARRLCFMVGGDARTLERCRPIFELSASTIVHAGAIGCGATVKLCNNVMTYAAFVAAYEATRLAAAGGVERAALDEVGRANGVLTEQMQAYLELRDTVDTGPVGVELAAMIDGFTALAEKDLDLALDVAGEGEIALPAAALCRDLMATVYGKKAS